MSNWANRSTKYHKMRQLADIYGWRCHYCNVNLTPLHEILKMEKDYTTRRWIHKQEYFVHPTTQEPIPAMRPTIDHKIPRSTKKDNSLDNLVLCCWQCNIEKGARYTYQEFLELKQGE